MVSSFKKIIRFFINLVMPTNRNSLQEHQKTLSRDRPWFEINELKEIPHVTIGRFTYGLNKGSIIRPTVEAPVSIGNFCSFAPNVVLLAHADHPTNLVTTYPFKTLFLNYLSESLDTDWTNKDATTKGPINIGNDVWVGQNVTILSGVNIGNGAIIGAGAVVTKSIPPYAIAVGNPAKVVKYRFENQIIDKLNETKWWNMPDEELITITDLLYDHPSALISHIESKKQ